MFEKALGLKLDFSYKTKFFLTLWLGRYEAGFSNEETIKEFSLKFDIPFKWVSTALDELLGREYFVSQRAFNLNNRMYTKYAITKKLQDTLDGNTANHISTLESLIFKRSEFNSLSPKRGEKRVHSHFNIADDSRLLLAVLIHISDDCGVVTKCGVAELNKLTGMSKDKIKSHVELLVEANYINRTISGLAGKYILGVKEGVFFLNLKHPSFLGESTLNHLIYLGDRTTKGLEAYQLFHPIKDKLHLVIEEPSIFNKYLDSVRFFEKRNNMLADYYQNRVNHYAMLVIINHSNRLNDKCDSEYIESNFLHELEAIESELIPDSVKRNIENYRDTMARSLSVTTLYMAIKLAKSILHELSSEEIQKVLKGRFIISKYADDNRPGGRLPMKTDIIFTIELFN
jgi:hypothetical protein